MLIREGDGSAEARTACIMASLSEIPDQEDRKGVSNVWMRRQPSDDLRD